MWPYYGSKSKIVDLYPSPKYGKIIEPFAGSARYSLKYFDREVLLVDKYPVIVDLWKYLKEASEADILSLPGVLAGQELRTLKLDRGAELLIGFCINNGSSQPKKTGSGYGTNFNTWSKDRKRIAKSLYKIRHWEIRLGSYEDLPNEPATWFIDPPYQKGGEYYRVNNKQIDYPHLAEWSRSRLGQVIVCENTAADWLPFYPMRPLHGQARKTVEAIWSNESHDFQARQEALF
jgi:site-specific DNA-adenine methylase